MVPTPAHWADALANGLLKQARALVRLHHPYQLIRWNQRMSKGAARLKQPALYRSANRDRRNAKDLGGFCYLVADAREFRFSAPVGIWGGLGHGIPELD